MDIQELQALYSHAPLVKALQKAIANDSKRLITLEGLAASSAPVVFSALPTDRVLLFVLQDADDAGYFYHDLTQLEGEGTVLFFPSSYKRAIKYGQKDPASEVLRTEVLAALNSKAASRLHVVTYPEALAEMVVTRRQLDTRTISLEQGQTVDTDHMPDELRALGFHEVDYVYEPGQFAQRGSILDVFSYSHEYPFRIDFFGDEIDSIRTFEVENQLSKERRQRVDIVPELTAELQKESLLRFLPEGSILVFRNYQYVREAVERAYQEGFSQQAMTERLEGATEIEARQIEQEMKRDNQIVSGAQFADDSEAFRRIELRTERNEKATIAYNISPQPLFHKNFQLLLPALEDYLLKGYKLYILADSPKQIERLRDIFAERKDIVFTGVNKTLHEGFVDHDARLCLFTDHQIFDRFHKYNLKSDKARSGKVALTLKEIQQFEIGDYVVHIDHGIGKFGGLVKMPLPNGEGHQEMIKIIYQRGDAIYVSIHSLYKVS